MHLAWTVEVFADLQGRLQAGRQAGKLIREALPNGGELMLFVGRMDAQNARGGARVTTQHVFTSAVGRLFREFPMLNARIFHNQIHLLPTVDVVMPSHSPGLMMPSTTAVPGAACFVTPIGKRPGNACWHGTSARRMKREN